MIESLKVSFEKTTGKKETISKIAFFNSKPSTIINKTETKAELQLSQQRILNSIDQWISEGSGWVIKK